MENLDRYVGHFNIAYPDYADARYIEIIRLVTLYDTPGIQRVIDGQEFGEFVELLHPLVAIKNYKSQVPFPENIRDVMGAIVDIRKTAVCGQDVFANHIGHFNRLSALDGFQLPTVSAVFHFSHPEYFPIVDVNVKRACQLLRDRYPDDFGDLAVPILPAPNTSSNNKLSRYNDFIAFITRIMGFQNQYTENPTYRYIDKALMVLGVPRLRAQVENVEH